jgi:hypothetical protein
LDYKPNDIGFKFVESINRKDIDRLSKLMTNEHTFIDGYGESYVGKDTMIKEWKDYFQSFPEYMIHLCECFKNGHSIIFVGRNTGSHLKNLRNEEFKETLIGVVEIKNGLVDKWIIYDDTTDMRKKLDIENIYKYE